MNDLEKHRWFQWIAGDRKGEVMVFDKFESEDEINYIVFKDQSRINEQYVAPLNQKDLSGKYMAEVDSPTNIWKFSEEWVGRQEEKWEKNADGENVCVQPYIPGKKIIKLLPPKPSNKPSSNFQSQPIIKYIEKPAEVQSNINTSDPVYILISKSKKIDTEINMDITVSLPSQSLYNIAKESFEVGDQKFIEYIIENITVKEIKDALKDSITSMYENLKGP